MGLRGGRGVGAGGGGERGEGVQWRLRGGKRGRAMFCMDCRG